jgi:hypothetical protein
LHLVAIHSRRLFAWCYDALFTNPSCSNHGCIFPLPFKCWTLQGPLFWVKAHPKSRLCPGLFRSTASTPLRKIPPLHNSTDLTSALFFVLGDATPTQRAPPREVASTNAKSSVILDRLESLVQITWRMSTQVVLPQLSQRVVTSARIRAGPEIGRKPKTLVVVLEKPPE